MLIPPGSSQIIEIQNMTNCKTIDKYIDNFPEDIKSILRKIRQTIRKTVPGAVETISYGIPTFDINGKHLPKQCFISSMKFS